MKNAERGESPSFVHNFPRINMSGGGMILLHPYNPVCANRHVHHLCSSLVNHIRKNYRYSLHVGRITFSGSNDRIE